MKFINKSIITAGNMSLVSVASDAILIDQIYGYSLQCTYSGAPSGSLRVQASNDLTNNPDDVSDWDDVGDSVVAISASGDTFYNLDAQFYKYFRVKYDRLSGSGSLTVVYFGKGN